MFAGGGAKIIVTPRHDAREKARRAGPSATAGTPALYRERNGPDPTQPNRLQMGKIGPNPTQPNTTNNINKKGKGSPYSITERRIPELIPVLGSQPAGEQRHDGCEKFA